VKNQERVISAVAFACGSTRDPVDSRRADLMNPPSIFAQLDNPLRALSRRGKMNVRELGDGMPERVIHLTQRAIPTVDVRDNSPGDMRSARRRECFNAIADNQNDVALQLVKRIC
jgi:hypothetical protein